MINLRGHSICRAHISYRLDDDEEHDRAEIKHDADVLGPRLIAFLESLADTKTTHRGREAAFTLVSEVQSAIKNYRAEARNFDDDAFERFNEIG